MRFVGRHAVRHRWPVRPARVSHVEVPGDLNLLTMDGAPQRPRWQARPARYCRPLLFLLPALLLCGCIAVPMPGPHETFFAGEKVSEQDIKPPAFIGKSRQELVARFGEPAVELDEYRALVYPGFERKGDKLIILGFPGIILERFPKIDQWMLFIALDADERVIQVGVAEQGDPEVSINKTVRAWMESQGLKLPSPHQFFTMTPVPSGKSRIHLYRTKPPTTLLTILGAGFSCPWPVAVSTGGPVKSELSDETFVTLTLDPGEHELSASILRPSLVALVEGMPPESRSYASRFIKGGQAPVLKVTTLPGQRYFIELACTTGTGSIKLVLAARTEMEAMPVIGRFRSVW